MAIVHIVDALLASGRISEKDAERIRKSRSAESSESFTEIILRLNLAGENEISQIYKSYFGIETIDLDTCGEDADLAGLIPKAMARKFNMVPARLEDGRIYMAMKEPLDIAAQKAARTASKQNIIPCFAIPEAIDRRTISLYENREYESAAVEIGRSMTESELSQLGSEINDLDGDASASLPAVRLVNSMIEQAASERASDIHIEPSESKVTVRMRIDGVLRQMMELPVNVRLALTSRIKVMGGMDVTEKRIPQDGRANVKVLGRNIDLRISTLPSVHGEKTVIRLLDKTAGVLDKKLIGLSEKNMKFYQDLLANTAGVILMAGPTGSGKTSTMYTMIKELTDISTNLVTLEDPVELNFPGITQVQINEKTGLTFASGLRSILRQDPDIIAIGEIRDGETAEICMRAAITGHMVLSTIHTNDAVSVFDRLKDIGVPPYLTAAGVSGIISQRLVRKICPKCRQEYEPGEHEFVLAGLERSEMEGHRFYKGCGCSGCMGTGYRGRTGVFEILPVTSKIRRCIAEDMGHEKLEEAARETGYTTLRESSLSLLLEGQTTLEEMARVVNSMDL